MERVAASIGLLLMWVAAGTGALPARPRTVPGLVTWSTEGPLEAGRMEEVAIEVPPGATVLRVLLHLPCVAQTSLRTPEGASPSSASTRPGAGFDHVRDMETGLELLSLDRPPQGTYVLEITGSACDASQKYEAVVEVETSDRVHFDVSKHAVRPGDELVLRGSVESAGKLVRAGVWRATIIAPDGTRSEVRLADDGAHADLAAGDGIFGAILVANGPVGFQEVRADVTLPPAQGGVVLTAVTGFDLSTFEDLAVVPGSVQWSLDSTSEDAAIRLTAQVKNLGTNTAHGIEIEFTDDLPNGRTATTTIDIDAGETCTVAVPWESGNSSQQTLRVTISPFHLRQEADYGNNTARFEILSPATVEKPSNGDGASHPCRHSHGSTAKAD